MRHRNYHTALILRLILLGVITAGFVAWTWEMRRTQSFGRYTRQQALEHARPLLQVLASRDANLLLSVDPYKSRLHNGELYPEWDIEVLDTAGSHLAYIRIDADTGDLMWAVPTFPLALPDRGKPERIDAAEAVERSKEWLVLLGMASESRTWQLEGPQEHTAEDLWSVAWRAGNRATRVLLNNRGELVWVQSRRIPSPG